MGGLIAQGVGTSMLQVPNIVKKPLIWLPVILSSAVLGPVSTMLFHMTNNATGSGMGSAGFVGQIMTWQVMAQTEHPVVVLLKMVVIQFMLPAVLTVVFTQDAILKMHPIRLQTVQSGQLFSKQSVKESGIFRPSVL